MDMSNRSFFSHINPDGKGPGDRLANAGIQYDAVAENIAQNQNSSDPVTQAVNDWMNPAKARGATDMNNIIDSENQGFSQTAAGIYIDAKGNCFITMMFSKPHSSGGNGGGGGGNGGDNGGSNGGGGGSSGTPPDQTVTVQGQPGLKSFWSYDSSAIGGGGKAMVNLWGGNLAVQYTDVSFPGRGLPIELRRTYNSKSTYRPLGNIAATEDNRIEFLSAACLSS